MEVSSLPNNLREILERFLRIHKRGLLTDYEATNELINAIFIHVDDEMMTPDPASSDSLRDALILTAAKTLNVTNGFLAYSCGRIPPGNDARLDEIIASTVNELQSLDELDDRGTFELVESWLCGGGRISAELVEVVNHAEPLSGASWLRYLNARNIDDIVTQRQVVDADIQAGCPASLLVHLEMTDAPEADIREALAFINADMLQEHERWGDLASVAIFLAERGWFAWARTWSCMIHDECILPLMTFTDHHHHAVLRHNTQCSVSYDARVFAPLALIDLMAEDPARAARRVDLYDELDSDVGAIGWWFVGHKALIDWVRSRLLEDHAERRQLLESIRPRHTWLGLLRAQISTDLADLAAEAGDQDRAHEMRDLAARALQRPEVELHFGSFPYNGLLRQLPCLR